MRRLAIKRRIRGSALVLVLWMVIVMTLVATVTARISRLDGSVSQLSVERIRCRWAARAGVETAVALLVIDDTPDVDALTDLWADYPSALQDVEVEGGTYTTTVTDEAGRLNLNTVTEQQLAVMDDATQEVIDSLMDWRDSDTEPRAYGAEDGYYLNQPYGYYCRNGEFKTVRELLLVRGVDEELVYGRDGSTPMGWSPWIDLMTCYSSTSAGGQGTTKININSANRNSLRSDLGLSDSQAQWVESHRQFQNFSELMDANKQATNSGNNNNNQGRGGQTVTTTSRTSSTVSRSSSSGGGTSQNGSNSQGNSNANGGSGSGSNGRSNGNAGTGSNTGSNGRGSQTSNQNSDTRSNGNTGGSSNGGSSNTGSSRNSGSSNSGNSQSNSNSQDQGTPLDLATVLRIADRITFGNRAAGGKVNLNTADVEVLEILLGGKRDVAEGLVAARAARESGFTSFADLRQIQGLTDEALGSLLDSITLTSNVFRIQSEGMSAATGQRVRIEAVVDRGQDNGRVLYWREE